MDQDKILENGFNELKQFISYTSEKELSVMKKIYFAGAAQLLAVVAPILNPDHNVVDEEVVKIQNTIKEIYAFSEDWQKEVTEALSKGNEDV